MGGESGAESGWWGGSVLRLIVYGNLSPRSGLRESTKGKGVNGAGPEGNPGPGGSEAEP